MTMRHPHVANVVLEFLAKKGISLVPQTTYSPDLALCDFWLFPTTKKDLKGKYFVDEMAALKAFEAILKRIPQEDFASVFQKWQKHWDKTIAMVVGDYIEGNKSVNTEEL